MGKPGREAIKRFLKPLQVEYNIDVTIANAENAAAGKGLTKEVAEELYQIRNSIFNDGESCLGSERDYEFYRS